MLADFNEDARFMRLALSLGRRGLGNTWPNPAVGAVVVRDGVILGRGWTEPGGRPHAETQALKLAGKAARGATLYVTLEPCSHQGKTPPCADAVIRAGISRVVSALEDPNPEVAGQGHERLRARGIAVDVGIGAEEAQRAHAGHIRRQTENRPHVTFKLAMSADGKAGAAGRRPVAITGEPARERVFLLRAMSDAILIGLGTALADNPALTCRLPGMLERSPVRVVLDAGLRIPLSLGVVATARETPTWIFGGSRASPMAEEVLRAKGVEVFRVGAKDGRLDLAQVLKVLAERGITRLLVEGGPTVAASFVTADLVDEAVLFRSEKTIGPDGIDALEGLPLQALTQSKRLTLRDAEAIGADKVEFFERV
ncbi:MAG: diaminohydroxyphosphoribosylaminopyrimidine deaminase [Alphaproteobacteria bacterium]|jgi:diaminohydroxyphosphoribosylaminopyrimidine deaminase/5-amino-6-(5-phosphoribosylamino)uracil reductase|nr:diaminohydroxyphosphoribosylaminopyrimidine deaminase [Alphaproteobacteria bacterium]